MKETKKNKEKNKHYAATVKINGKKKEFLINTGSPITIMPPDEEIIKSTGLQKITNKYQDVNKNEVKFRRKIPVNLKYERKQTEKRDSDKRKNRHNNPTRIGLQEGIQINNRKNATRIGQKQPLRTRESIQSISVSIWEQWNDERYRDKHSTETGKPPNKTKSQIGTRTSTRRCGTLTTDAVKIRKFRNNKQRRWRLLCITGGNYCRKW